MTEHLTEAVACETISISQRASGHMCCVVCSTAEITRSQCFLTTLSKWFMIWTDCCRVIRSTRGFILLILCALQVQVRKHALQLQNLRLAASDAAQAADVL
eukprot:5753346-Amphidinium_carterae.2